MFGFSMGEMLLIMAIALIAIGPKQLPEVARTLGRFLNELKRATGDFTKTFTDVRDDTRREWTDVRKGMNDTFTAGAAAYNDGVRASPDGTVSTVGHQDDGNSHAPHDEHGNPVGYEVDPQGSLFLPTDDSHHETASHAHQSVDPSEEQLEFLMNPFVDPHTNDDNGGGTGSGTGSDEGGKP